MILVYFLIALTFAMILTALVSYRTPINRRGEVFIGIFVSLMVLAWAADEWLMPALAAGLKISWLPVAMVIIFCSVLVLSIVLTARTPRPLRQTILGGYENRRNVEAEAFDLIIWFAVFFTGISLLRAVGI